MGRNSEENTQVHNDIVTLGAAVLGSSWEVASAPPVPKKRRLKVDGDYDNELGRLQVELSSSRNGCVTRA